MKLLSQTNKTRLENPSTVDTTGAYSDADYDKIDMILESPDMEMPQAAYVNRRVLGTFGIVAITYLTSVGGPAGSEPIISSAGPLVGMLAFVVYPIVFAIPYAFIVAELCSIFPEDGGFAVWVLNAFGPFWGFQVGFWSWVSSVFNGALLPGMIFKVITWNYQWEMSATASYLLKAAFAMVLACVTLLGTRTVGRVSIVALMLVMVPFAIFTVWAFTKATEFDDLGEIRHQNTTYNQQTKDAELSGAIDIQWTTLLNTLFWNYNGVYIASVFGGEVSNPARTYRRAILITMLLTMVTYLVPMPAAICSNEVNWTMLDSDSYPFMALLIGGRTLQALIVVACVCSNSGNYMATLYSQAFMITGMAENNLVPQILGKRNAMFGSPHVAILITFLATLPILNLDFENLLALTNTFALGVQILVVGSAIQLRRKLPYAPRPTKVPGGMTTLYAMGVLPVALFVFMAVDALTDGTTATILVVAGAMGVGYGVYQSRRHRSGAQYAL